MKKFHQAFSIQFFVLFLILIVPVVSAQIEVTRTDDPTPDGCNSGTDCSLREAIIAANDVGSGTATIQLTGGQTYTLSRVNSDTSTDSDATTADEESGSLKILNNDAAVRIEVVGSGLATIDADEIDRVFILYPGTDVEIDEIEITGGKPNGSSTAGGIMVIKNENLMITNSTITGNSAGDGNSYGAGMWIEGSTVAITGSTISNNTAGFQGGGLRIIRYNEEDGTINSDVTIENSIITNNDGGQWSGGFHIEHSDVTITESTISDNQSTTFGGGFRISSGNVTFDRSTINGNTGGLGGGLDIGGGEVLILNSTISDNNATNFNGAGGIYAGNFSDAVIDIVNTTITNNTSGTIGGIIRGMTGDQANAVINLANSIVANQASGDDCSGTITSKGYNLSSDETCDFTETGDLQNSDPLLGTLQDNGGPVFTHAITSPLSPAVNNGSNALYTSEGGGDLANDTDASGNDRVYDFASGGIIDIGSFELQQDAGFDGCPVTIEDKILYVKKGDSGTGANWSDALGELRDALALFEDETCTTDDVEEIWVTAGTYLPTDDSGDREATFLMPGVNILGGFEGDENNENQRDVESNISVLSGDIDNDDTLSGNSYHVVTSMDEASGTMFNFTITGGNADGAAPHDKGGGLYASNGGISMGDVLFENNFAETAGGGAYVIETVERIGAQHPSFFRTTFMNNESGGDDAEGGGLALYDADSRITSITFENNYAEGYGGGLFTAGSNGDLAAPVLKNVIFKTNSSDLQGGGMATRYSSPELYNALFIQNTARFNGGAVDHALSGTLSLFNSTIYGNEAEETATEFSGNGGGIYNRNGADLYSLNSIIWGNTAALAGNEIWNAGPSSAELFYSLYGNDEGDIREGGGFTADENSLTINPLFENAVGGDLTLSNVSPAINMGDPDTDMSDFKLFGPDEIDLAENPRVYNGDVDIIDMGAYEFQGNPISPSSCPATDNILYVKKGESGTGSGWDDALGELRDVYPLFDSEDCTAGDVDEIWVAAGTYLPTDNSSDRTASFTIIDDVDWYGGFAGVSSETTTEDRDLESNVTILSGDIDDVGGINGNSYHVLTAVENTSETILDGFTITGGNAELVDVNNNSVGGGLYVDNGTLTIRNSVFNNNFAEISGGGVFIKDSGDQPIFNNVEFSNNSSDLGGGLASENSSPRISQSRFLVNFAEWGGGARLLGGSPLIDQSVFTGNTGNSSGGAISLNAGGSAKSVPNASAEPGDMVLITNSVISGNESKGETGGGGGIINEGSYLVLRNVLISGNSSDGYGGGIEFADTESALIINSTITGNQSQNFGGGVQVVDSSPTVQNSIIWNNDSIEYESERIDNFSKGAGDPIISFSLVQGCNPAGTWDIDCGTNGGDNMSDTDPLFDTGITPGDSPTTDGDFSLTSASPVINIGSNTLYTDSGGDLNNDDDLAVEDRLFDGNTDVIDLGAYEFQGEPDGEEPEFAPFITTWEVEAGDLEITIPTVVGPNSYDYDVDWGDGETDTGQTGDASHTYDSADTYTVKITGTFPQIQFFEADDKDKIQSVEQWGDIEWASMRKAFQGATNLEINASDEPDLSNATSMLEMFSGATSVNDGLENWDVSTITSMFGVFDGAISFNGDITGWTVSEATDMIRMFAGATSFNQNLGGWDISSVATMESMLSNSGLSTENYDAILTGWAAQTVESDVDLGADGLTYCNGADARGVLTGAPNNWTITGDELAEDCGAAEFAPLITTWKTDNPGDSDDQSIRIPMIGNGYDFNVDWGDGNDEDYNINPGDDVEHFLEHTYSSAGEYEVKITGDFPRIYINSEGDEDKILTIDQWGDIAWTSMKDAFRGASNLTYNATDAPDLSGVTNLSGAFKGTDLFNGDIGNWDVSTVTDMSDMFAFTDAFNQDIGYNPGTGEGWDVSNVTNMNNMFQEAEVFNRDIGGWDVSSVTTMADMFSEADAFNQDIGDWNVSNVTTMEGMFFGTDAFNQDIGYDPDSEEGWDVSSVTDMSGMFAFAGVFNQDISGWDVSSVTLMLATFFDAGSFNQDLGGWDISSVTTMESMLGNSGLSTENYDATLTGWAAQTVESNVDLGADGLTYCDGADARGVLTGAPNNWTITGDELSEDCGEFRPFITTWKTDNPGVSNELSIRIPMIGNGYDFNVDWGDGNDEDYNANPGDEVEHFLEHTYASAGEYEVKITGDFPRIYIDIDATAGIPTKVGDNVKILSIEQWGDIQWSSMESAFRGATNLTYNATDAPDLSGVTSMARMFNQARSFNGDIGDWDVSNVTDMSQLFAQTDHFNSDLSNWNVSNVTDMKNMFNVAKSFNNDINEWDTKKVTNMRFMFAGAEGFDKDLSNWDVSNVTDMRYMFAFTDAFNQDIGEWDVSNVTDMQGMFFEASNFNHNIGDWDVSSVIQMNEMFANTTAFNQDISDWDVSSVEVMSSMFRNASSFNQNLENWDVSSVTNMAYMFDQASSFNQDLGDWDITSIAPDDDFGGIYMISMLDNSGLSTENYDATLTGWESQSVQNDMTLGAAGLTYCNGETARQSLIDDHNWSIIDDGLAGGCTSPEGEDQRILVSNASDYEFSKSDFGISNDDFFIKIETLPGEGMLELDGSTVNVDDEISIEDIINDDFTWDMPANEYGYNFTSFDFRIVDDNENQSDNPYTLTIDLGTIFTELSGSEGWRFMTNPSDGDSYFDLFSGITVETGPPPSQTLYELDQENYEWDPIGSTADEPGVGTPFIVYVLNEDLPVTIESGDNWDNLDGSFDYNGLNFDNEGTSPNPGNFYLLGNPHPIALDFCEFIGTDIATSAYFWEPNANGESNPDTNVGNGDYIDLNCAASEDVLIAPFQSFWVRTTDSNPSLEIPMEAYLESTTEGYFKESSKGSEPLEDLPLISFRVTAEEGIFTNRAQILFKEDAKPGLDRYDAPKLSAEGLAAQWLSFYSMDADGRSYSFQSLPSVMLNEEKVRIPMDIRTTESGLFTLDWTLPASHLFSGSYYLKDNRTGEVIELREGSTYDFEITTEERSAKSQKDFADLGLAASQPSDRLERSEGSVPRFELLIAATGIDGLTELGAVPDDFTLAQNYPNPFNPTTVISYQLPVSSEVRLEVYDMLGRNVATLVDGQVSAGRHTVNFDARNLSSGVYLYRLQAGSQIMTRKLTILK